MSPATRLALVRHAAPVLLGKKPAALFTLPGLAGELPALTANLAPQGLCVRPMRRYADKLLLLVYVPALLAAALADPLARQLLLAGGYPAGQAPAPMLDYLETRMAQEAGFPHEIGFFLGYPAEDVAGFICHRGANYKLCGRWKVYGDVARAKALFQEYQLCSDYLHRHLENGGTLLNAALPPRQASSPIPQQAARLAV